MPKYLLALAVTLPAALLLVSQSLAQPAVGISAIPSPDYTYPGEEATVRVDLLNSGADPVVGVLEVYLVKEGETLAYSPPQSVEVPPGENVTIEVALWIPREIAEPGVYTLKAIFRVDDLSYSSEAPFLIAPTLRDVAELAIRLAKLDRKLERLLFVFERDPQVVALEAMRSELAGEFGELVRLTAEGGDPRKSAEVCEDISQSLEGLEASVESMSDLRVLLWSISREVDSSLEFSREASFEFWFRIFTASVWAMIIVVLLFPLYSTGYLALASSLAAEIGRGKLGVEEARERAIQILRRVDEELRGASTPVGMFMIALAGALATVGLMADNIAAIIGSMLLSPLMSTFVAGAVGLALLDVSDGESTSGLDVFYSGFRAGLKGAALVIIISWITALLARAFVPLRMTEQLALRASPNLADLAIAIGAGFAGAVATIHERTAGAGLVGAAVAIALVPPASAIGVGLAMLNPSLIVGSSTLFTVNIVAIVAAGYLSAKLYALYPIARRLLEEIRATVEEAERTARTPLASAVSVSGAIISGLIKLGSLWLRVTTGLLGGITLSSLITSLARKVAFVAVPIFFSWVVGAMISTQASEAFSSAYSLVMSGVGLVASTLRADALVEWLGGNFLIVLSAVASAVLLKRLLSETARARKGATIRSKLRVAVTTVAFWASSGYLLGLQRFPHVAAAYSLLLASLVLIASSPRLWSKRRKLALYGFVVFTLLTLMVHSAAAFERARAAETLGAQGVTQIVRGVVASYAGVLPSDVDTSVEIREGVWIVHATVTISESRLRSGVVMTPKIVSAARVALEEALGVEVELEVEYRIVP